MWRVSIDSPQKHRFRLVSPRLENMFIPHDSRQLVKDWHQVCVTHS